jgi:tetratricopeptide (TPR) repeat protein
MRQLILLMSFLLIANVGIAQSPSYDPQDPFSGSLSDFLTGNSEDDKNKSATDLLFEARLLLQDERPLDARTKLLLALQKEPKNIDAHILLASYYMGDVGHFRLALKYVKQAERLFNEANGPAPYQEIELQQQHANILYLLAQVRLNLDEYQESLKTLDLFSSYGYFSSWYPGTRAWVLMKLGRLDEAIQVARMGTLLGSEPGRTLNMLGILLSMKGERETSLDVLKKATAYELSLGKTGQPATPLNNSGEVYKEMFAEPQAETAWIKATSLPDGCEHVLPSLNLTLLYIDQLDLPAASKTIDSFESCVAQFPLKNGEEHRSLVQLARGRIALHRGQIDKAIKLLSDSLAGRQWFGKIGTDQEDLDAGARVSLAQALRAKINRLKLTPSESIKDSLYNFYQRSESSLMRWWLSRRARQILSDELNALEDLTIRHTDSLLEYPTLGEILAPMPLRILTRRVELEDENDSRRGADPFYLSYLAAGELEHGSSTKAETLITRAFNQSRPDKDDLLRLYLNLLRLQLLKEGSENYNKLALGVFTTLRPALRSSGLRLPVNGGSTLSQEAQSMLYDSGFLVLNNSESPYSISYRIEKNEHLLEFKSVAAAIGNISVRGGTLSIVCKNLADSISTIEDN